MGLRDGENLFLREDGSWEDAYVPAYIRRYPFIFSELPGGDQLTLCIDNNKDVIDEKGEQKPWAKRTANWKDWCIELNCELKSYSLLMQETNPKILIIVASLKSNV